MQSHSPIIYFAESRPYGIGTGSDGDQLVRFDTAAARDAWVADDDDNRPTKLSLGPQDHERILRLGLHEPREPARPARRRLGALLPRVE